MNRPYPPALVIDESWKAAFVPAPELWEWVASQIISDTGKLHNPDHEHLVQARILFLWTNTDNSKRGKRIAGMAEIPQFMCNKWQKARQEVQIIEWFGEIPDFIITLDAHYCQTCEDSEFCALVEHELYHCAQKTNEFGMPKFNQDTGMPSFEMRGHDVEEFIGVVRRYGAGHPEGALSQLIEAGKAEPEIHKARISVACGTCMLKAA